ncbi:hypothetical protein D6745_02290 [Candidatus Woesearchaeota archaeon]|nr:MAG: hypothetical protein D6745_02290 [Candidatus Woesearchaeota archaeon]
MKPENEIVTWWLNKRGFFTINSINASKNKVIDMIALRMQKGVLKDFAHIEISCSTTTDNLTIEDYQNKFNDRTVTKMINQIINKYVGKDIPYQKVLVVGHTTKREELEKITGITILDFNKVLSEVLLELDKQNYQNNIIRSLQLIKYLHLAQPEMLARLITQQGTFQALTIPAREKLIKNLLKDSEIIRILAKKSFEEEIKEILRKSTLRQPEKLSKTIPEILSKRSNFKFLRELLKNKNMKEHLEKALTKKEIVRMMERKEKPLNYYMGG